MIVVRYITVDVETLISIIMNKEQLLDPRRLKEFGEMDGDHIHFLSLESSGNRIKPRELRIFIREYAKRFKTVSWFNRDFTKLRGFICHQ